MKTIKIFWKEDCPNCPSAKELGKNIESKGHKVELLSLDKVEGLSQATFFGVMATPSIVITDKKDKEIKSWLGKAPEINEILEELK